MAERTEARLSLPPLKVIGTVTQSSFTEKFATPRQGVLNPSSSARIELEKTYSGSYLDGLRDFSHCWILWWFHLNSGESSKAKVFAPRKQGQKIGVFSTRSPHRPNPIGLSCVRILQIEDRMLHIGGVDFVKGTPIIDIKPYIQEDHVEASSFGWTSEVECSEIEIIWDNFIQHKLSDLDDDQRQNLVDTIEESLKLDPRPNIYKKLERTQGYAGPYGAEINGYNIRFTSENNRFTIIDLQLLDET